MEWNSPARAELCMILPRLGCPYTGNPDMESAGLINRRKRGQGRPAVITLNYPDGVRFVERKGDAHESKK